MKLPEGIEGIEGTEGLGDIDLPAGRVFGEPYQTPDGTTVVPVARWCGRAKPGAEDAAARRTARPLGVFVVKDGAATWQPVVDVTRVALLGELIGLVSAALIGVAMVRRPPWPDLKGYPAWHAKRR